MERSPEWIMNTYAELTDEEIEEIKARTAAQMEVMPNAVAFAYDEKTRMIRINLDNNTSVIFPLSTLPALQNATPAQIRNVRFVSDGMDIWWDDLDVQHTVEYILGKATGAIATAQSTNGKPKISAKRGGSKAALKKKSSPARKDKRVAA
jgi:hypothetical protein